MDRLNYDTIGQTEKSEQVMSSEPKEIAKDEEARPSNFIRDVIDEDMKTGRFDGRVHTRFPPEPNGYMHIGHCKAIAINFGIANAYGGKYNLRFDDTNPSKEETEYVEAIIRDIKWLGFDWEDRLFFASDYFDTLYEYAVRLIKKGAAYVDHLNADEIREYRGTLTEPGKDSPYRDRSVEANLDLFERMKNGEFAEGECVLRGKIDMASGNINMRDPVLYRIQHAHHHRTGDKWHIYPMYDFAHGQSDSIEGITHSLCSLEFEAHRPLYDWFLDQLEIYHPQQIEFGRLSVTYMITSKRKLRRLVEEKIVRDWDDPRMPTLAAMRRRGYPPQALVEFAEATGVAKKNATAEIQMLEYYVRQHLNKTSPRIMGVLNPLKLVITNYPEDQVDEMQAINNPEDPDAGTRKVPFSRVLYIEQDDFREDPPRKFYRLSPGREVRLRYAYFVTCTDVIKDNYGNTVEVHCTYDPETYGGTAPDGRKVKSTLHWVSAQHALKAEARLYDYLFTQEDPSDTGEDQDIIDLINPASLQVVDPIYVEPSIAGAEAGRRVQFERMGYFVVDPDSTDDQMVFNRTVGLRDQWAKLQKQKK